MCHQRTLFVSVLNRQCDVIVEVCHPNIVKEFGTQFLSRAHVMVRNWFYVTHFVKGGERIRQHHWQLLEATGRASCKSYHVVMFTD